MENNNSTVLELEEKKKLLQRQYTADIKALDDAISIFKRNVLQHTNIEEKKLGRKPSEILVRIKNDIIELISEKKKGLSKRDIISSLSSHSNYKLSKEDFEGKITKATNGLKKQKKLICIGGTRNACWYLPEWIENGKIKNEFNIKEKTALF